MPGSYNNSSRFCKNLVSGANTTTVCPKTFTETEHVVTQHNHCIRMLSKKVNKLQKMKVCCKDIKSIQEELNELYDTIVTIICYRLTDDPPETMRKAFKHSVLDPLTGDSKTGHPKAEATMPGSTVYYTDDLCGDPLDISDWEPVFECEDAGTIEANVYDVCGSQHIEIVPLTSLDANTSISLGPKPGCDGFISATRPDGTVAGGDCRGVNAVDWQIARTSSDQVSRGNYSGIGGGVANKNTGNYSYLGGGENNKNFAERSFLGCGKNNEIGTGAEGSAIISGEDNVIGEESVLSTIGGGFENIIGTGVNASMIGNGELNKIFSNIAFIGSGENNVIKSSATASAILSGENNEIGTGAGGSSIVGGVYNTIGEQALLSVVVNGELNKIFASKSFIGSGQENEIGTGAISSAIINGLGNIVGTGAETSLIGNGVNNVIGENVLLSAIVNGQENKVLASQSFVGGGQNNVINISALNSAITNGLGNIIGTGAETSLIGNGVDNVIGEDIILSTIVNGQENKVLASKSFIGSGQSNMINVNAINSSIDGGSDNIVLSATSHISNGINNQISSNSSNSFIGGGIDNMIDVGILNATIPGGQGLLINNNNTYARCAVGQYNLEGNGPSGGAIINERIFVVGNGPDAGSRSNAMSVDFNGNVFAGGAFSAGGADYAEYFESIDGQSILIGSTVVLEGDKIRLAQAGEIPMGVVSVQPTVIGNDYTDHWHGKYKKNIWGQIQYFEETSMGGLYKYRVPTVSEVFDPTLVYIPRKNRPEWNPIALMGQVCVRKGHPVAPTWIKMKDLSAEVEMWLIK